MPRYQYADALAEQLGSMVDRVPDAVDVVQIAQPDVGTVQRRLTGLVDAVTAAAGLEPGRPEISTRPTRTSLRVPGRLRGTGFHASSAMSVVLDLAPFDDIFEADPGGDELTAMTMAAADRLGLAKLLPDGDSLAFERLWRIRAAGGDPDGRVTEPVLCRAVGAFRHYTRELPVYGRASATVELAAGGKLASVSLSTRRFADDDGGKTVATAKVRRPDAAARDAAAHLVRAFGGAEELRSTRLVPEWFRFGYLSLGRRRAQGLLAPFYVASVAVDREYEASAHVIAVAGSEEQYVRLPSGQRSAGSVRKGAPSPAMAR